MLGTADGVAAAPKPPAVRRARVGINAQQPDCGMRGGSTGAEKCWRLVHHTHLGVRCESVHPNMCCPAMTAQWRLACWLAGSSCVFLKLRTGRWTGPPRTSRTSHQQPRMRRCDHARSQSAQKPAAGHYCVSVQKKVLHVHYSDRQAATSNAPCVSVAYCKRSGAWVCKKHKSAWGRYECMNVCTTVNKA